MIIKLLKNEMMDVIRTLINANATITTGGKEKYLKLSDFVQYLISKKYFK